LTHHKGRLSHGEAGPFALDRIESHHWASDLKDCRPAPGVSRLIPRRGQGIP
jgi:hypothetical protein